MVAQRLSQDSTPPVSLPQYQGFQVQLESVKKLKDLEGQGVLSPRLQPQNPLPTVCHHPGLPLDLQPVCASQDPASLLQALSECSPSFAPPNSSSSTTCRRKGGSRVLTPSSPGLPWFGHRNSDLQRTPLTLGGPSQTPQMGGEGAQRAAPCIEAECGRHGLTSDGMSGQKASKGTTWLS